MPDEAQAIRIVATDDDVRLELPDEPPAVSFRGRGMRGRVGASFSVAFAALVISCACFTAAYSLHQHAPRWSSPTRGPEWALITADTFVTLVMVAFAGVVGAECVGGFRATRRSVCLDGRNLSYREHAFPFPRRLRVATVTLRGVILQPSRAVTWSDRDKPPRERPVVVRLALAEGGRRTMGNSFPYPLAVELADAIASHVRRLRGGGGGGGGGGEPVEVFDTVDPATLPDPLRAPPGCTLRVVRSTDAVTITQDPLPPLNLRTIWRHADGRLGVWCALVCAVGAGVVHLLPPEITPEEKRRMSWILAGTGTFLGGLFLLGASMARAVGFSVRVERVSVYMTLSSIFGRRTHRWNRADILGLTPQEPVDEGARHSIGLRLVGERQATLLAGRDPLTTHYVAAVLDDALGTGARKK